MHMKNVIIGLLAIAILSLGGLVAVDKFSNKSNTSSSTSTSSPERNKSLIGSNKTLDQSNKGLAKVGADIYGQKSITELILSNNNLKSLPSEMGKMTKLEILKLDHNLLEGSLIGEIRMMPLTHLDVSYNNMTGVPAEIGQVNKLQTLNYSYNKITELPNELANLKNTLKELNLTGNPLTQDTINKIKASLPNTKIIL